MKVTGKSVRSLTQILKISGSAKQVRFTVAIDELDKALLSKLGFSKNPDIGECLIPTVLGKYTAFNANGNTKIRKDLPMEPETIMYYGASRDWHGGIHHGIRTRTINKYPREYIAAPSEIFQILEIDNKKFISSSELNLDDIEETRNVHVSNIMLECFNAFEIFDVDKQTIVGPTLKRLQWDILPKGEYPWEKSKPIIDKVINQIDKKDKKVIEYRMRSISLRNPDFLATGRGGFNGYFVYGFSSKGVYVLESIHLDNATYIFNSDWESLSQLSKNDIINSNLPHTRIIHNKKWGYSVGRAIDGK